jgi:hypothetical protein
MNKKNLISIARYLPTIRQENFDMLKFRTGDKSSHECNSIGCVIGHCTILDDYENIPRTPTGQINFQLWSEKYTGLPIDSEEWAWCFSEQWAHWGTDNTPIGAAKRIIWLITEGLPENWREQITGEDPLCYTNIEIF